MKSSMILLLKMLFGYLIFFGCNEKKNIGSEKMNVLFIAVDDLRPELGCYGNQVVKSPNIDQLANKGILFTKAYAQQSMCGPSRVSILTGLRPFQNGVTDNRTYFRNTVPDIVTFPQHFKKNGYKSFSIGKIYHGNFIDSDSSWSQKPFLPKKYHQLENRATQVTIDDDVSDTVYQDGQSAKEAIRMLQLLKNTKQPFFLGIGFHKPHLSFHCPKKYWDLYDPQKIKITHNNKPPRGAPSISLHNSYELRVRDGVPDSGVISDSLSTHLIHGYYACVSYVDAQIGKILDELKRLQMNQNTIIVLWGDHGWHLGDFGIWGKATNYEIACRVPLIIYAPEMKSKGKVCGGIVELLDIYPTLCDLTGIPIPKHVQGESFSHLLDNPKANGKDAAISQFPCPALREWAGLPLDSTMKYKFMNLLKKKEKQIKTEFSSDWEQKLFEHYLMGYSMRTERYRIINWVDIRNPEKSLAIELYDHNKDPKENENLSQKSEYNELINNLLTRMGNIGVPINSTL